MGGLRDTQRQKVYNAETRGFRSHPEAVRRVGLAEAQTTLDILVAEFQTLPVTVGVNRRIKAWGGWYQSWMRHIEVPTEMVPMSTVLHEFAHHLAYHRNVGVEGHGGGFTEAMLDVVTAWVSPSAAVDLEDAYTRGRCKIGGHHVEAKLAAAKEKRDKDGEMADVYLVGYLDTDYSDKLKPYYFTETTGWYDQVSAQMYNGKQYKTLRGARKAAEKVYGSLGETAIIVFKTLGRYNGHLDEYTVWEHKDSIQAVETYSGEWT